MAFFRNLPAPQAQTPSPQGAYGGLGGLSLGTGADSVFGSTAMPPAKPAAAPSFTIPRIEPPQGYSLSPQASPRPNGSAAQQQQAQGPAQGQKKDAFADLVDLMS